jgi:hypothetical protein
MSLSSFSFVFVPRDKNFKICGRCVTSTSIEGRSCSFSLKGQQLMIRDFDEIDICMRRVRAARQCGLELAEVVNTFKDTYTPEQIFLAWHAASILDRDYPMGEIL